MKKIKSTVDLQQLVECLVGDWDHLSICSVKAFRSPNAGSMEDRLRITFSVSKKSEEYQESLATEDREFFRSFLTIRDNEDREPEHLMEIASIAVECGDEDILFYKHDDPDVLEILYPWEGLALGLENSVKNLEVE